MEDRLGGGYQDGRQIPKDPEKDEIPGQMANSGRAGDHFCGSVEA